MSEALLATTSLSSGATSGNTAVEVFTMPLCPVGYYNKIYVDVYTFDTTPSAIMILVNSITLKGDTYYPHDADTYGGGVIPDSILTLSSVETVVYGFNDSYYKLYFKLNSNTIQCMYSKSNDDYGDNTHYQYGINGIGFAFY